MSVGHMFTQHTAFALLIHSAAGYIHTLLKNTCAAQTLRDDLKLKMKDVEAKKRGTEVLLDEMGAQRSEAEAQQVHHQTIAFNM